MDKTGLGQFQYKRWFIWFWHRLNWGSNQGNLIRGEGSDSLKTTLETKGKTA